MAILLVAVTMVAAACGSSTTNVTSATSAFDDAAVDAGPSAADNAAANLSLLEPGSDARDHEVLSVADGSIATLRTAVTGDRPVLLWFWAPH